MTDVSLSMVTYIAGQTYISMYITVSCVLASTAGDRDCFHDLGLLGQGKIILPTPSRSPTPASMSNYHPHKYKITRVTVSQL